jgi:hypothetical protein
MAVRLIKPYSGQAANTLWWGAQQSELKANGIADDQVELATDYAPFGDRTETSAAATVTADARKYTMNSGSAQALTLNRTGYFPKDTVLTIQQVGAGATTVTAGNGVTISGVTATTGANKVLQLIKGDGETWVGVGG